MSREACFSVARGDLDVVADVRLAFDLAFMFDLAFIMMPASRSGSRCPDLGGLGHAVEKLDDPSLETVLRADDEHPIALNEAF